MDAPARPDTSAPAPEDRLAALREEITRVGGRDTALIRIACLLVIGIPAGLFTSCGLVMVVEGSSWGPPLWGDNPTFLDIAGWLAVHGLPWAVVAITGALTLAALHRNNYRHALRKRLESMPVQDRAAVLLPLRSDARRDTRKIVAPLIREFGLPTELTPAGTPEGSGAEVSGVDHESSSR